MAELGKQTKGHAHTRLWIWWHAFSFSTNRHTWRRFHLWVQWMTSAERGYGWFHWALFCSEWFWCWSWCWSWCWCWVVMEVDWTGLSGGFVCSWDPLPDGDLQEEKKECTGVPLITVASTCLRIKHVLRKYLNLATFTSLIKFDFAVLRCTSLYFVVLRCTSMYFAVLR